MFGPYDDDFDADTDGDPYDDDFDADFGADYDDDFDTDFDADYFDADPGEMDGDHDSCMTSIGWGTDEDYGDYGYDPFDN